jgi:hypothetical protein
MDHKGLRYIARVIALVWSGWWTIFGLIAGFAEGYSLLGIILHAIFPGVFFLLTVLVAWKWEIVGTFLILGQALLTLIVFWFARTPVGFTTLTLPPMLAAILFLADWLKQRKAKHTVMQV